MHVQTLSEDDGKEHKAGKDLKVQKHKRNAIISCSVVLWIHLLRERTTGALLLLSVKYVALLMTSHEKI